MSNTRHNAAHYGKYTLVLFLLCCAVCLSISGSAAGSTASDMADARQLAKSAQSTMDQVANYYKIVLRESIKGSELEEYWAYLGGTRPNKHYIKDNAANVVGSLEYAILVRALIYDWAQLLDADAPRKTREAAALLGKDFIGNTKKPFSDASDPLGALLGSIAQFGTQRMGLASFRKDAPPVLNAVRALASQVYKPNKLPLLYTLWDYEDLACMTSMLMAQCGIITHVGQLESVISSYGYRIEGTTTEGIFSNEVVARDSDTRKQHKRSLEEASDQTAKELYCLELDLESYMRKHAIGSDENNESMAEGSNPQIPRSLDPTVESYIEVPRGYPWLCIKDIKDAKVLIGHFQRAMILRGEQSIQESLTLETDPPNSQDRPRDPVSDFIIAHLSQGLKNKLWAANYKDRSSVVSSLVDELNAIMRSQNLYDSLSGFYSEELQESIVSFRDNKKPSSADLGNQMRKELNNLLKGGRSWKYGGMKNELNPDEFSSLIVLNEDQSQDMRILRPAASGSALVIANRMLLEHAYPLELQSCKQAAQPGGGDGAGGQESNVVISDQEVRAPYRFIGVLQTAISSSEEPRDPVSLFLVTHLPENEKGMLRNEKCYNYKLIIKPVVGALQKVLKTQHLYDYLESLYTPELKSKIAGFQSQTQQPNQDTIDRLAKDVLRELNTLIITGRPYEHREPNSRLTEAELEQIVTFHTGPANARITRSSDAIAANRLLLKHAYAVEIKSPGETGNTTEALTKLQKNRKTWQSAQKDLYELAYKEHHSTSSTVLSSCYNTMYASYIEYANAKSSYTQTFSDRLPALEGQLKAYQKILEADYASIRDFNNELKDLDTGINWFASLLGGG